MVKLFALSVLYKPTSDVSPTLLKAAYDLQQFSFFQRSSVQEFMGFTSKIITERCDIGSRQSVKEQEYMVHVCVRQDGLAGVVVSDHEYQYRVAHTMIDKVSY
ncbi:Longin domain, partial [Trinorchestia longiramus]